MCKGKFDVQIFGLIYLHNFKANFQFQFLNFAFLLINIAITCFLSMLFLPISWFFPREIGRNQPFTDTWLFVLASATVRIFSMWISLTSSSVFIAKFHVGRSKTSTFVLSNKFIFSLAKANKFSTSLLLEATQGIPRHDGGSFMVKNKLFLLPKIWARFPLLDSLYYHFQLWKADLVFFGMMTSIKLQGILFSSVWIQNQSFDDFWMQAEEWNPYKNTHLTLSVRSLCEEGQAMLLNLYFTLLPLFYCFLSVICNWKANPHGSITTYCTCQI